MKERAVVLIFFIVLIIGTAQDAEAYCNIVKSGKVAAIHDGIAFRRGNTELGTFDGRYVRKKGVLVGQYDGNYLKKKGVTIGSVDGYQVKGPDGATLYTISDDGTVRKNGRIYLRFSRYSGIFDIRYLIAVYLLFFDK